MEITSIWKKKQSEENALWFLRMGFSARYQHGKDTTRRLARLHVVFLVKSIVWDMLQKSIFS